MLRILKGWPIQWLIIGGYALVVALTTIAPQEIVGIAYDSGGVTTSTITVPLVTALGVGLASAIRGRNPMIDGFGLIAFASLMPIIFVSDLRDGDCRMMIGPRPSTCGGTIRATLVDVRADRRGADRLPGRRAAPAIPNLRRVLVGSVYVVLGPGFFLFGLEHGPVSARQD